MKINAKPPDMLKFRRLVRQALSPGIATYGEAYILSAEYALATPPQQAACVAAVKADIKAMNAKPTETQT